MILGAGISPCTCRIFLRLMCKYWFTVPWVADKKTQTSPWTFAAKRFWFRVSLTGLGNSEQQMNSFAILLPHTSFVFSISTHEFALADWFSRISCFILFLLWLDALHVFLFFYPLFFHHILVSSSWSFNRLSSSKRETPEHQLQNKSHRWVLVLSHDSWSDTINPQFAGLSTPDPLHFAFPAFPPEAAAQHGSQLHGSKPECIFAVVIATS